MQCFSGMSFVCGLLMMMSFSTAPLYAQQQHFGPLDDGVISCAEMQKFPELVFVESIDLGSGHGSPVEVDYTCDAGLAALPFMTDFLWLAEKLRGQPESGVCTGTIIYAQWRYYHFRLLKAGIAPRLFLDANPQLKDSQVQDSYFAAWAAESPSNYRLRQAFIRSREQTEPLLEHHYLAMGLDQTKAKSLANRVMGLVYMRAAGAFPGSSSSSTRPKQLSALAAAVSTPILETEQVAAALDEDPAAEDIDQALKLALSRNAPLAIIQMLTERLDSLDRGDESALFFALSNRDALIYLLDKGASINYANGFGKTALFYAIENAQPEVVSLLLERGADLNHSYKSVAELEREPCAYDIKHGLRTPLMHAAQHADLAVMALLIEAGARLRDLDSLGWSALDYAVAHERSDNADYLRSKGG